MLAVPCTDAVALSREKGVRHQQRPKLSDGATLLRHKRNAAHTKGKLARHGAAARRKFAPPMAAPAPVAPTSQLSGDLAAVKLALDLVRKGKTGDATALKRSIDDPAAQKLAEWLILRHPSGVASFGRYSAFIAENPSWPSMSLLRRRA